MKRIPMKTMIKVVLMMPLILTVVSGIGVCEDGNGISSVRGIISDRIEQLEQRQRLLFEETRQISDGLVRLQELEKLQKELADEIKHLRDVKDVKEVLAISEDESEQRGREVLSLAGREYTLRRRGSFGLDYDLTYTYHSSDAIHYQTIEDATAGTTTTTASVEGESNHKLVTGLTPEFGIFNNLTVFVNLPFVCKYNKKDGGDPSQDTADITDIGDIKTGFQWQPFRTGTFLGSPVLNIAMTVPTGTSPYDTSHDDYMATGSGYYSAEYELVFSKAYDPLVVYSSLGYVDNQKAKDLDQNRDGTVLREVAPGDDVSLGFGAAYALSYKASVNLSVNYTWTGESEYTWDSGLTKSPEEVAGMFYAGCGLKYANRQMIVITTGIGLTDDSPDFTFSVRLPFNIN